MRLVDPDPAAPPDSLVGPGEEGEVIVFMASPETFAGYWQPPDANEKAIRGDWYYTGDLATADEDGDLWVSGRVDDMINSGGENVYPDEIEAALIRRPDVEDMCVVGLPDERWGHAVTASRAGADAVGTADKAMATPARCCTRRLGRRGGRAARADVGRAVPVHRLPRHPGRGRRGGRRASRRPAGAPELRGPHPRRPRRALAGDVSKRLFEQFAAAVEESARTGATPATTGPSPLRMAVCALLDAVARRVQALRERLAAGRR